MKNKTCKSCKYFKKWGGTWVNAGSCRRYPPCLEVIMEFHDGSFRVNKDDWCGEYKSIKKPNK